MTIDPNASPPSPPRGPRIGSGPVWAVGFAVIATLAAAMAAYMHLDRGLALTSTQVLVPSLGAVYFGFRAIFALVRPRR